MKYRFFEIFQDERDKFSSNRFVGIMCAIALCISLFIGDPNISVTLINVVGALAFGALGLGAANKIFKKELTDQGMVEETHVEEVAEELINNTDTPADICDGGVDDLAPGDEAKNS